MIVIPGYIAKAISLLETAGFEAYAVGGCVRDSLMGRIPDDWDMTTNADAQSMKRVFADYNTIETGLKHGTLTVIIDSKSVEITTYRIDGEYEDNRHPKKVTFCSSLKDDLARRDFTVNAMAYNPSQGLVDCFGGRKDIENRTLRCVGEPGRRFHEDALRILRAVRFSSVLGFDIEKETAESLIENRQLLCNISVERIFIELKKLLCGKNVYGVLMNFQPVLAAVLPEIQAEYGFEQHNFHHIYTLWEHTAVAVRESSNDIYVRLALLFHDCGKPLCQSFDGSGTAHYYSHAERSAALTEQALLRLKADRFTVDEVTRLVKYHDAPIMPDERIIKRKLNRYGKATLFRLLEVQKGDNSAIAPQFTAERIEELNRCRVLAEEILSRQECFSLKSLAVNGNDLMLLGYSGVEIGKMLNFLLEEVVDGRCKNERKSLLDLCARKKN